MGCRAPQAPFPSPYKTQAGYMGSLRYQVPQDNNDQPSRNGSSGGRFKREGMIAQLVKNLPAMQEMLVQFLGWEDPLEKG